MTTPSQWRKLHEASDDYVYFMQTAMALCHRIRTLEAGVRLEGEEGPEKAEALAMAAAIAGSVQTSIQKTLMPYIERLEKLAQSITSKLPKPPGSIVLPGEEN